MSDQPEALRVADALEKYWAGESRHDRERQGQKWWNDRMFGVERQYDALLKEIKDLQEVLVYSIDNQGRYKKKHQKIVDTAIKVMEKAK